MLVAARRFTALWLAHNSLGPAVVDALQDYILHNFRARVLPEENPLLVTASNFTRNLLSLRFYVFCFFYRLLVIIEAMAALRKELDGLPAAALRERAAAVGVDAEAIQKAVVEAEKAKAASELTGVASDGKGPCHKLLISKMVSSITHSQSMSNGS